MAAYDDAAGVTAEFNRNVLRVLNRELDADFDPERFEHVARWTMPSTSGSRCGCAPSGDQTRADRRRSTWRSRFADGEELRTEISAKFRRPGLERELDEAGFDPAAWWDHPTGDFALIVARVLPR